MIKLVNRKRTRLFLTHFAAKCEIFVLKQKKFYFLVEVLF